MPCEMCANVVEREDVPHVIRVCPGCGREMHIHEPGEHGRGFRVMAGDRPVIPAGWIQISLNPLKSTVQFTRPGLEMAAATFLLEELHQKEEEYPELATRLEAQTDAMLTAFPPLAGLDINNSEHTEQILTIMQDHKAAPQFWALWTGQFLAVARQAVQDGETTRAVWATACAERCRSMLVFKQSLEDVVWMGYSAKRIINALGIWDAQRKNSDEEFWQLTFNENSYVLSQVFAIPMVFLRDKAYVGGMKLDRNDSRFVDYLFSMESSREAILIEIKSPTTRLLGGAYRGIRPPSRDLSGAVVQALDYRAELSRNLRSVTEGTKFAVSAFAPRVAVVAGDAEEELRDDKARRSFELFRTSLKDVEVITFDELFRKVEILAELFGLKRSTSDQD